MINHYIHNKEPWFGRLSSTEISDGTHILVLLLKIQEKGSAPWTVPESATFKLFFFFTRPKMFAEMELPSSHFSVVREFQIVFLVGKDLFYILQPFCWGCNIASLDITMSNVQLIPILYCCKTDLAGSTMFYHIHSLHIPLVTRA